MRQMLKDTRFRLALGIGAVVAIVVVGAAGIYVFGAGGRTTSSRPISAPTVTAGKNGTVFTIDASASKATFTIHEVLFGSPHTVVGTTSTVAGQIVIDKRDPTQSQVGEIKVDLTTLVTDSNLRDNVIQGRILETSDPANQYATFVAKSLSGMPASVSVGQQFSFQVTGDLTIHQVTKTETFTVQVTPQSQTVIVGTAQTTVKYEDFNLRSLEVQRHLLLARQ
jgi:polyisoprenoid-binding protein YceI